MSFVKIPMNFKDKKNLWETIAQSPNRAGMYRNIDWFENMLAGMQHTLTPEEKNELVTEERARIRRSLSDLIERASEQGVVEKDIHRMIAYHYRPDDFYSPRNEFYLPRNGCEKMNANVEPSSIQPKIAAFSPQASNVSSSIQPSSQPSSQPTGQPISQPTGQPSSQLKLDTFKSQAKDAYGTFKGKANDLQQQAKEKAKNYTQNARKLFGFGGNTKKNKKHKRKTKRRY